MMRRPPCATTNSWSFCHWARIWAPQMAVGLKAQADESYQIAADQDVEAVNTYISPMIGSYFR